MNLGRFSFGSRTWALESDTLETLFTDGDGTTMLRDGEVGGLNISQILADNR